MELTVTLELGKMEIVLPDKKGTIYIADKDAFIQQENAVDLFLAKKRLVSIGEMDQQTDRIISIVPTWEIESQYLEQEFVVYANENHLSLSQTAKKIVGIPKNQKKIVISYMEEILTILDMFGYSLIKSENSEPIKPKKAKAAHRWSREVSQIPFYINDFDSKATAFWQKRNEMLIKKGAKLKKEIPLNKDGSVGFSARLGEKIRADHQDAIKNFVTTEDIILKSVNEVGIFLYFGGTNSWLVLTDDEGKTINEWTVIE